MTEEVEVGGLFGGKKDPANLRFRRSCNEDDGDGFDVLLFG